mgnify:CR=1 FL=1
MAAPSPLPTGSQTRGVRSESGSENNSFTREAVFNPADLVLLKRVRLRGVGEVEYGGPEYLANGWPDLDLRFIQAAKAPELDGSAIEGFAPNTPEQICEVVGMALEDKIGRAHV